MKAVILAGGLGTRISEETQIRPKPMIEIGGEPILWHLMKFYSRYGINDFIICLGYKGYVIKEYFHNYAVHRSDVTIDLQSGLVTVHDSEAEPWRVTLVDTGADTLTGGRLKRVRRFIGDEPFCFTYGDGLSDVNLTELIAYHHASGRLATLTAVQPPGRFGALALDGDAVVSFREKADAEDAWINGGFFVLDPKAIDYVEGDDTAWESGPLERLAADGQLNAFHHRGFWHPLDTLRDKTILENLWASGSAPWRSQG
jgi:glucose-1-phosphate cytidylyltransferase